MGGCDSRNKCIVDALCCALVRCAPRLLAYGANALLRQSIRCAIESLLSNATLQSVGNGATCAWGNGSTDVVVYYEEGADEALTSDTTISLAGG